jgi:hypothetical protein
LDDKLSATQTGFIAGSLRDSNVVWQSMKRMIDPGDERGPVAEKHFFFKSLALRGLL